MTWIDREDDTGLPDGDDRRFEGIVALFKYGPVISFRELVDSYDRRTRLHSFFERMRYDVENGGMSQDLGFKMMFRYIKEGE